MKRRSSVAFLFFVATMFASSAATPQQGRVPARLLNKVDDVRSRVDVLPRNPDLRIRDLYREVEFGRVRDTFELFRQGIDPRDALNLRAVLRDDGFIAFRQSDGPDEMRADLRDLLDQLKRLATDVDDLRCYDDPNAVALSFRGDGKVSEFVDVLPPVALYGMKLMLDEFTEGQWRTLLDDVLAPEGLVTPSLCNAAASGGSGATHATTRRTFEQRRCDRLRRPIVGTQLLQNRAAIELVKRSFGVASEWTKDSRTFGVTLNVGAGGGAVIDVSVPVKPVLKTIEATMDAWLLVNGNLRDHRKECIADDDRRERDLLQCVALAEYASDGGFAAVHDLAIRRMEDLPMTSMAVEDAQDFGALCVAYQDLRGLPRVETN